MTTWCVGIVRCYTYTESHGKENKEEKKKKKIKKSNKKTTLNFLFLNVKYTKKKNVSLYLYVNGHMVSGFFVLPMINWLSNRVPYFLIA